MKHLLPILLILFFSACGTPTKKEPKSIIDSSPEVTEPSVMEEETITMPSIPKGAISANFFSGEVPFYAYVKEIDRQKGITFISFEKALIPDIILEKTYGATLSSLRFAEFESDLLLVTARLKDPNFKKYHLFVLKNNQWKPVVNSFAIHMDNRPDTLNPIWIDPENPENMQRYYSVFDLNSERSTVYTWLLLKESIPIINK
jgi:hypothetical protein